MHSYIPMNNIILVTWIIEGRSTVYFGGGRGVLYFQKIWSVHNREGGVAFP